MAMHAYSALAEILIKQEAQVVNHEAKIPSSKSKITNKFKIPSTKLGQRRPGSVLCLVLGICLNFVICNLLFSF
jgi:hypothetical protein